MIHAADRHALLPFDKGEADAEFQDERFHFAQYGGLKVFLCIAALEAEKIEDIGITKNEIG